MKRLLIEFHNRKFAVAIEEDPDPHNELRKLIEQVEIVAKGDPYLTSKLKNHYQVFEYFDPLFKTQLDYTASTHLEEGVLLKLKFCPKTSPVKVNEQHETMVNIIILFFVFMLFNIYSYGLL
jgi:hypothetical protein